MDPTEVAIGIVLRAGNILICQRHPDAPLGGFWEFPGGKHEPPESLDQTLVRELREELAIDVRILEPFPPIEFRYATHHVRLHPYLCQHLAGDPRPLASQSLRWVKPAELLQYRFPPANDPLIRDLIARFALDETESRPTTPQKEGGFSTER